MNLQPSDHPDDLKVVLEAALLAAIEPLSLAEAQAHVRTGCANQGLSTTLRRALDDCAQWHGRGVELVQVADGWRFRRAPRCSPGCRG
jgi:segregation and condensation protein B